ncbi:MAG: hypothetical protein IKM08_09565 [Clostridia bacterium]|nr:hypothetical protein [Clostridia bacterium]
MLNSCIESANGRPELVINGKRLPAAAYTTYFEERSRYEDFIEAGYRIFFVNISMTALPINSAVTGFTPFYVGVFEDPDHPDYSEFEDAVRKILRACPDAYIFPRIYVSMPRWWTVANDEECIDTPKGGRREFLGSEQFRRDGAELLRQIVSHIKAADYAPRIAGWQLCGGQTQEWFFHDLCGYPAPAVVRGFRCYMKETYGVENAPVPDFSLLRGDGVCEDENARRYVEYCNVCVAQTLEHFAKTVKEMTDHKQVVGAFYGYVFEKAIVNVGSCALRTLLDSPHLDFFSSPNAYTYARRFGIDWADMLPVDAIKRHGKLAFVECDIRTYLTTGVQEARPGVYPKDIYPLSKPGVPSVWSGPPTPELSRAALRKCFAHQLTKGSGIWWFDMWGGWYDDPLLMETLAEFKDIQEHTVPRTNRDFAAEVAVVADEQAKENLCAKHAADSAVSANRIVTGNVGAPFDGQMVEDFPALAQQYKAFIFPSPIPSPAGERAMALCRERGIPYLTATLEHPFLTLEEQVDFLKKAGVHLYAEGGDVVYAGNGYVALHSETGGEKRLLLPAERAVTPLFGATDVRVEGQTVIFTLEPCDTALFQIEK